jgi:hypothetical protein
LTTDDGEPIEELFVNSDDVIEMLEELDSLDYDSECHIELGIDYDAQFLTIQFTQHLEDSSMLKDQDVQIDMFVRGDKIDDIGIKYNILEYACTVNKCELEFVKKYIDWFIDADKTELPDQLGQLILGNNKEVGE